jgi:hypothetical protein
MNKKIVLFGLLGLGLAAAGIVVSVVWFFVAFYMSMERGEEHQRQLREEQRSGKWDFGEQPALFAVADAIVKNDQDAIRAAAKALPNLQAPGRDGTTLLYFAVTQSWQRPESVEAVKTLLPRRGPQLHQRPEEFLCPGERCAWVCSFSCATCLRLVATRNARNEFGEPMILMNWYLGYYKNDARRGSISS